MSYDLQKRGLERNQAILDCMNVVKELIGEDHPDATWLPAGLVLGSLGDLIGDEDERYRAIYS